jgi:hypothetical protein
MYQVILVVDPATGRGLYKEEEKRLGVFGSLAQAAEVLGNLLNFCTIQVKY